ncbi:MAG TPA: hypothetical protein DIT04_01660 [Dysgonomonas sp.]|nr:hypothetical protein [Dysgonomonas sp.]
MIDIRVEDHIIINTKSYISFKNLRLIYELKKSIKYVAAYQLIEKVSKEEQKIRIAVELCSK